MQNPSSSQFLLLRRERVSKIAEEEGELISELTGSVQNIYRN